MIVHSCLLVGSQARSLRSYRAAGPLFRFLITVRAYRTTCDVCRQINVSGQVRGLHKIILVSMDDRSGRINRDGPVSVWSQVAADLAAEITSGVLAAGARLPAEPELAGIYGVSRITVRRAIRDLAARGLVVVSRGRGTYVTGRG
jgi:hypothetical protein